MRRRDFLALLALSAAASTRAWAQQSRLRPKIGYLFSFTRAEGQHLWEACRLGLRDHGYVEEENILLEPRWADGRHERLPQLVQELVSAGVQVIVAAATPANLAAKQGAGTIPIVMVAVADPIKVGLIASFNRPGGNTTGLSLLTPELSPKRVELLVEFLGNAPRIGTLSNPANASHAVFFEETLAAATQIGVAVTNFDARDPDEIERAFQKMPGERVHALIVFDDPAIWSHRKLVVALADKMRLPTMYGYSEFVREGGLISYGPHRLDLYRRTARYVDSILKGAKPADLPVERPTRFELVLNLRTAHRLGLTAPATLLARADEVIE